MKTIIIALLFTISNLFTKSDNIRIFTETYPPYNMKIKGKLTGLSVEVLDAMLKEMKSKQILRSVTLTNWARGYSITQQVENTMLFSTTRTKEREKLFKWVGPIAKTTIGIIAPKRKNIKIKKVSDLNKYKIGAVFNDIGDILLTSSNVNRDVIQYVRGRKLIEKFFKKMEKNRIDMFAYATEVAFANGKAEGFDTSKYEVVYVLKEGELYFAFNKNTNDSIINKWQKALDKIKANGLYAKIMKKY